MLLQFKEVIRSKRNKPFTFIVNSIGMILAFTAVTIIFTHTYSELDHDHNVTHRDDIVLMQTSSDWGLTPGAYGPWLASSLPEIQQFCRITKQSSIIRIPTQEDIEGLSIEEEVIIADSTYATLFSLQFLQGNMQEGSDKVILSESTAKQLFGKATPIGKQLILNNDIHLTVSAIFKDVITPALYNPKIIVPVYNSQLWTSRALDDWGGLNFETYLQLRSGSNYEQSNTKFKQLYAQRLNEAEKFKAEEIAAHLENVNLRKYSDVYFSTPLVVEKCSHGNLSEIKILVLIALLVLLVSIINYVNIATAKVVDQSRNIGLKRTLGAKRLTLIHAIVFDAVVTCFIAMGIAFFIAWHLSPYLSEWIGTEDMSSINLTPALILLFIIPIICGILSGIFPAIYLTRTKDLAYNGHESRMLRKSKSALMVFQFAISLGFIISTLFIYKQVNYVKSLNPGYDRSNLVVVYGDDVSNILANYPSFRNLLLQNPEILKVGVSRDPIFNINYGESNLVTGWDKGWIPVTYVDAYLLDLLGLNIIEGPKIQSDELEKFNNKVIINEQLAKAISSLIPPQNYLEGDRIAVMKDINYKPMHEAIGPMFLKVRKQFPTGRGYVYIRIAPEQRDKTLAHIKNCYNQIYPDRFYRYSFMEDDYNRLYGAETLFANRLLMFTILSIVIACLGLLAFAVFFIEQNIKNIGIRKVVGATEMEILSLLNRDFLTRLLISFLISVPIVYYLITSWLSPFAYKIELSWWVFTGAFLIMACLTMLSVSILTWRAATANPVDSLKSE